MLGKKMLPITGNVYPGALGHRYLPSLAPHCQFLFFVAITYGQERGRTGHPKFKFGLEHVLH